MIANQESPRSEIALADALRRGIVGRTSGRMRELDVQVEANRITIRGVCSSYYVKQLAIQEVCKLFADGLPCYLDMDFHVDDRPTALWHHSRPMSNPLPAGNA
jgi:hypothetical protein